MTTADEKPNQSTSHGHRRRELSTAVRRNAMPLSCYGGANLNLFRKSFPCSKTL